MTRDKLLYRLLQLAILALVGLLVWRVVVAWQFLMIHLSQETGTSNANSRAYAFWSGFGSDIGEIAILGGLIHLVRQANCHTPGCWRMHKRHTPSGVKLCHKCAVKPPHPDLEPTHADHM